MKTIDNVEIKNKINLAKKRSIFVFTDFFYPEEYKLYEKDIYDLRLKYNEYGGIQNSERNILGIYDEYAVEDEIPIEAIKIKFKAEGLTHRDFLGSILSLGIKRSKIGDIYVLRGVTYVILKKEVSDFVLYNLEKVKNTKVLLEKIDFNMLENPSLDLKEKEIIIPSYRLDVIISKTFNISREKSKKLIISEMVSINHKTNKNPSYELIEGDVISIRKHGKFILNKKIGNTKKNNYKLLIGIYN